MKTTRKLLEEAVLRFPGETAFLDALLLLEWTLHLDRETILASLGDPVPTEKAEPGWYNRFTEAVERRSHGLPLAYITGKKGFYGHVFSVTRDVLIPRPDTEVLVEETLRLLERHSQANTSDEPVSYHDCCTGSGCVAVSVVVAALERLFFIDASMSDISETALSVAQLNANHILKGTGGKISSMTCNVLRPISSTRTSRFDVISANPPYLTDDETVSVLSQGWEEPELALAAGPDGLGLIKTLLSQLPDVLRAGGSLALECGVDQTQTVYEMMYQCGFSEVQYRPDLSGHNRLVVGEGYSVDS